jgi:hypothetical protein
MTQVVLDCPLCGLALEMATIVTKPGTDTVKNGAVGGHLHLEASGSVACLNGHRWQASGNFLLTRS